MRSRCVAAALGALAVLQLPGVAYACPVCFSIKNEANQVAYLATTGFMTLIPIAVIGGAVWWLKKRAAELSRPVPRMVDGQPLRPAQPAERAGIADS